MADLSSCKIAFIGGGNMASAIIGGLLSANKIPKSHVSVSAPSEATRSSHAARGVTVTPSNVEAATGAHVVVIAVKPAIAKSVCEELRGAWDKLAEHPIIISVAAGTTVGAMREWLGGGRVSVVRVMPNTPSLVGEGAAGVYAEDVDDSQRGLVNGILSSMCRVVEWVDKEELINVVTSVSGSGPAYFFAMVEHMTASAKAMGLPADQAARLAQQTCLGAGRMMSESEDDAGQLRRKVTSPNGTTHAALVSFEKLGFADIVDKSMKACVERGEELGKAYG
ncbi:Pyrroline-5-carboxylate reductase-like protein [Hapsidospora chrysogenum ATCC 11550]|uniref:Pyrroline-5-carboxylate reductase n=1 Tax=Hapsidospora chrysogenum (strain ATCC 11550 / CBS 779.69 / DSM 880 / IAM 14645 / JCM 23072 / IMI 49137) TaxID=857340 RepID=A0A086SU07_HAPC1|nr:Pyrroline-5-carboxylate reductase-like protein [Hapsidospora chrysogenum ATCC 11550]